MGKQRKQVTKVNNNNINMLALADERFNKHSND